MIEVIDVHHAEEKSCDAAEFRIKMRDGTELATDVYFPKPLTQHEVILVRTPYDKCSRYTSLKHQAKYYTSHGYIFIAQDVRGKFRSGGQTVPYLYDVEDAYDTVSWITEQAWSNQKVGVTGDSYYGFTTWAAIACGHPAIKAGIPRVTGVDMASVHVGSPWKREIPNVLGLNDLVQIWTDQKGYLVNLDYNSTAPYQLAKAAGEILGQSHGVQALLQSAEGNTSWTSPYGHRHPYFVTEIPVLNWVNWYDPGLAPLGMTDWRALRSNPSTKHLFYLRANSADHSGYLLDDVGKGDEANPYMSDAAMHAKLRAETAEELAFFDEHVRGLPPAKQMPRARWHMGNDGWHVTDDWPPSETQSKTFYLNNGFGKVGYLDAALPDTGRPACWVHDPHKPVPSTASIEEAWYWLAAWPDERNMSDRNDVLTFATDPLQESLSIAGQPILRVHFRTSASNTHLFVKLQDVSPDGTTRQICRGQAIVTNHPGEAFVLPMNDIAYKFLPGHKIQLQLQSSDYPWYLVHPGTEENPWIAERKVTSKQSVAIGGNTASQLSLPIFLG